MRSGQLLSKGWLLKIDIVFVFIKWIVGPDLRRMLPSSGWWSTLVALVMLGRLTRSIDKVIIELNGKGVEKVVIIIWEWRPALVIPFVIRPSVPVWSSTSIAVISSTIGRLL